MSARSAQGDAVWPKGSTHAERITEHGQEIAFFLGEPESAIFGVVHHPASPRAGGVLICQSILGDFIPNYRREVALARELVADGIAVTRFHYRGYGHSSGDPREATFESMCDDSRRVAEHFVSSAGIERLALLGTRWGALVAAKLAGDHAGAPLSMWEPALTARRFFREGFRAQQMSTVVSARGSTGKPEDSLRADGIADVLGYPVGEQLFDGTSDLDLIELLTATSGPILYVGRATTDRLGKRDTNAVEALRTAGLAVDVATNSGPEAWWFIDEENATPADASTGTARWLADQLEASV